MEQNRPIDCRRCKHYFVTWDPHIPHGCRGMGFKSRQLPIQVVRGSTRGTDCLLYTPKGRGQSSTRMAT